MTVRFTSTLVPPPPGFAAAPLSKRELLGGPVVALVGDTAEVFAVVPDGCERIEGCIVTFASEYSQVQLGEVLWAVTAPLEWSPFLSKVMGGMLSVIEKEATFREQLIEATRLTERMQNDLQVSREDYHRVSSKLLEDLERSKSIAAENARLFQEARAALRVRDEFLSIASHEMKTPLTPLKLQIEAIRRELEKGDLEKEGCRRLISLITKADRQVDRLAVLIENLLDVDRISQGRLELRPETVDLVQIVKAVLEQFQFEIERTRCLVTLQGDAEAVGYWDPFRLGQVVVNLLSNALKFGAGKPVDITTNKSSAMVTLTICDHGIGIRPQDQPRLFQRYERAVSAQRFGGLGLGLYITREIVEAHHGKVSLKSSPAFGTQITVELPVVPEPLVDLTTRG